MGKMWRAAESTAFLVAIVGFWVKISICSATCSSGYMIRGACVPEGVSPLAFYVEMDDIPPTVTGPHQTFSPLGGTVAHVLNVTSQTWLTPAAFKNTSAGTSIWTHQLVVVLPPRVISSTAFLWITGGNNPEHGSSVSPISPDDDEVAMVAKLVTATGTVGAVLKQVPNQPVKFAVDLPHSPILYPNESRSEDGIIAYTWNHFIFRDDLSAEWALRLPMTKAVSKAMDAVTNFITETEPTAPTVNKFVIGGASKRGWTTWTTGLVDPRCVGLVPVVMDFLSVPRNTVRHYRSLGGWTYEFADYVAAGVCDASVVASAAYRKLMRVVDPISYFSPPLWDDTPALKNFRAIPKLVVDGGNDEFMLPDDNHAWWDDLGGEKHLLHIANADHPLNWWPVGTGTGNAVFQNALLPFYSAIVKEEPRPEFTWVFLDNGLTIHVCNFTEVPQSATMWAATTMDGFRDWRLFNCRSAIPGRNCTHYETDPSPHPSEGSPAPHPVPYIPTKLEPQSDGTFVTQCPKPPAGQWVACFVDVQFVGGFRFTTQMTVYPDVLPFTECTGVNCTRMV